MKVKQIIDVCVRNINRRIRIVTEEATETRTGMELLSLFCTVDRNEEIPARLEVL